MKYVPKAKVFENLKLQFIQRIICNWTETRSFFAEFHFLQ